MTALALRLSLSPWLSLAVSAWTRREDVSPRGQQWQNPSIVLKSRRTNVRPNSSINLQVNQARPCPYTPGLSSGKEKKGIPLRPSARLPRSDGRVYIRVRRVCIYGLRPRDAHADTAQVCTRPGIRNTLKCSRVFPADRPTTARSHASGAATISAILLDVDAPILIPGICCTPGECIMHPLLRGSRSTTTRSPERAEIASRLHFAD